MAALLAATMAYDVWRVPVQVYDSLIEILDAQRSPSVAASFRGSLDGAAYLRPARIAQIKAIYDVSGRLVRVICDEPAVAAGYHDYVIDGRGSHGEVLSSGVYFYRVEAAEGLDRGRFTILK